MCIEGTWSGSRSLLNLYTGHPVDTLKIIFFYIQNLFSLEFYAPFSKLKDTVVGQAALSYSLEHLSEKQLEPQSNKHDCFSDKTSSCDP